MQVDNLHGIRYLLAEGLSCSFRRRSSSCTLPEPVVMETKTATQEILLYQTEDGQTRLDVRLSGDTVWLSQAQMAELFQTTVPNINLHLRNIYEEGELDQKATIKEYLIVRKEGSREVQRNVSFYNLDAIISVGYRVKSHRGTQFRIWATQRLREYVVKGFTLDDERLKKAGEGNYFEELLARIRDIRSSEKVFWRKVLDIYATSIDYDPSLDMSQKFFATVQNKMHWAAHGHTAAEVIAQRADASRPHMGLTSWAGSKPRKTDVSVAKNYLNEQELDALNGIVTAYLEFAELQAKNRKPMYMKDWIAKLDDFLKLSERDLLTHAGSISHELAVSKAEAEFDKFHAHQLTEATEVEKHFEEAVAQLKNLRPSARTSKTAPQSKKRKRKK